MNWIDLATFAAALFVAAMAPGPGIAAIVARVLAHGRKGATAFCTGMMLGDVVWLSLAVFGLAFIAHSFASVFLVVRYAGAAYLLYLGWRMWSAPASAIRLPTSGAERPCRLFFGGLAVTLGNPKTIVFYLALMPNLFDLKRVTLLGYGELMMVTLLILGFVFAGYVVLAHMARGLFSTPRALRWLNRGVGTVMAGAAAAIASR
ncbi:threonine/homoserine/homoserine lactone efflux protein [Breoghania corrubedonensis]|uniref:Threonine/homoserine/homoserine lactone efflux protein n=1 Tax=Breoghania corrubedonensis TaxID=665038 RepID=A0A2T5VH32_9HYPH|nr:LysE family translocator [Breoghania corrubedonensis]PTW63046.1 threonine/homoserine/homoserine lactone efflux protein [Breoghania corrubedonensis]